MFWSQPRTGRTGLNHTALDRTPPPTPGHWCSRRSSYTSVLMLQLRVNMSLMVSERARLGLR